MKIRALQPSRTSVTMNSYQPRRCNIPEDLNVYRGLSFLQRVTDHRDVFIGLRGEAIFPLRRAEERKQKCSSQVLSDVSFVPTCSCAFTRRSDSWERGLPLYTKKCMQRSKKYVNRLVEYTIKYKVVQIWPGQTVTCLRTNRPGHIWTTLYVVNFFISWWIHKKHFDMRPTTMNAQLRTLWHRFTNRLA